MKGLKYASILMVPIAGTLCGYGAAAADPGNSAAAQGCLHEPMTAYYLDTSKTPGTSEILMYKVFENHGSCVSFFAQNKMFAFQYAIKYMPET